MGGRPIMPVVLEYLSARPGQPVTLRSMATELKLDQVRIQKALSNMLRDGGYGDAIEVVHRGQIWRWRLGADHSAQASTPNTPTPPARPEGLAVGDVVEVIGTMQTGDVVARDGDGRMYRVSPL
jgi:hypothetical protein